MYSTCLFCHRSLRSNDAIEQFPVGRRLAFDPAKGRLWVVCRRCERWNLSPLETRWEAIEECERRFRGTRLRASSENVGLARLPEGLELVRIGKPLRPEFAAWRWGDQFGRRRRRTIAYTAAGVTAGGLIVVGGAAAGISIGGSWWWFGHLFRRWRDERVVARLHDHEDRRIRVQFKHLSRSRLVTSAGDRWALELHHSEGWASGRSRDSRVLRLEGEESLPVVGKLMARVNRAGGRRDTIRAAVDRIEAAGHPAVYMQKAAAEADELRRHKLSTRGRRMKPEKAGALRLLPPDARLALEMAAQEEVEHEAMVGELAMLEAAWREAEEVAEIADNLLIPQSVEEFIRGERRRLRETEDRE